MTPFYGEQAGREARVDMQNNVVSTPFGAHLESQYGYDFYIASFTLKTGRIGISNTLIQPIS